LVALDQYLLYDISLFPRGPGSPVRQWGGAGAGEVFKRMACTARGTRLRARAHSAFGRCAIRRGAGGGGARLGPKTHEVLVLVRLGLPWDPDLQKRGSRRRQAKVASGQNGPNKKQGGGRAPTGTGAKQSEKRIIKNKKNKIFNRSEHATAFAGEKNLHLPAVGDQVRQNRNRNKNPQ